MDEKLDEVRQALTSRVNELRCLQRLVDSKSFVEAYRQATEEDREVVRRHIVNQSQTAIERWVTLQEQSRLQIEELPVRELRRIARAMRILDYNYLSRASLLSEIKIAEMSRDDPSRARGSDRATLA